MLVKVSGNQAYLTTVLALTAVRRIRGDADLVVVSSQIDGTDMVELRRRGVLTIEAKKSTNTGMEARKQASLQVLLLYLTEGGVDVPPVVLLTDFNR